MSSSEDFDIEFDEDFLQDVNKKEELYYTQVNSSRSPNEVPPKRPRLSSPTMLPPHTMSTRKNLILDIFSNEKPQSSPEMPRTSASKHPSSTSSPSPRRCLNAQNQNPEKSPESQKNTTAISKPTGKSLALGIFSSACRDSKKSSLNFCTNPSKFVQHSVNRRVQEAEKSNYSPPRCRPPVDLQKTVVRKFPGPAGLIPDNLDPSGSPESLNYLQLLDENDTNITNTSPAERKAEFCTQDTKNLFLRGAWRNMLNDLPENFLIDSNIASIKDSDVKKIPRLAVVIQQIDQGSENPHVILRDISDSIEGVMHRDLAMKYPNILHSGVALLLQDVGVLSFKITSFVKTKLIVCSIESLIAAYSEQGTLVKTAYLDAILNGNYEEGKDDIIASHAKNQNVNSVVPVHGGHSKEATCIQKSGKKMIISDQPDVDNIMELGASNSLNDEFSDSDFRFDDDIFNQIDDMKNNLEDNRNEGDREIIETIAGIEKKPTPGKFETRRENDRRDVSGESTADISSGFGDDLLNDSDSDDEYLSQIDIDAISKTQSFV